MTSLRSSFPALPRAVLHRSVVKSVTLRTKKAELQAQFDELSSSITNHTVFGQGRIIKAFPEMKHRDYFELIQELKKKLR